LISFPFTLDKESINFDYEVKKTVLKKLHLEIESIDDYSNLSLIENGNVLLDNLDVPEKGNFVFDILIDFKQQGLKKLEWKKRGGKFIIKKIEFSDIKDIELPTFTDISTTAGLVTQPSWKYGGPTIADVDNNGYYDLILNNHDKITTQLFLQKEKGKLVEQEIFSALADFHGTTAGDYDNDGDLDIVNSIGGGNGLAPKPPFFLRNDDGEFNQAAEEVGIVSGARGRSVRWIDLDMDGDLDLMAVNAEGFNSKDSIQHLFYENLGNGKFKTKRSSSIEQAKGERVLITDINNDQIDDLIMYSPISIWQGNGDFTFTDVSESWLPKDMQEVDFVNAITDIDIDNDGDLDLYLARGKTHYQMANKSLDFNRETGQVDIRDEGNKAITSFEFEAEEDIILSNQFLWTRGTYDGMFPFHLGEDKNTFQLKNEIIINDTSSLNENMRVTPEMAKGWASERTENGWYIGYIGEGKWKAELVRTQPVYWGIRISINGIKSITPVGWQPQNHNVQDILFKNNNNTFTDVSKEWNIPKGGNHWGVTKGDFNNDGNEDLYVYRFGFLKSRVTDWLLMNAGKGDFDITTSHNARDENDKGHGDMGQAFDFELDGDVDLLSGSDDNGKWNLYGNNGNDNNHVLVRVGYSPKENVDPYSAIVIVETDENTFRKRVGSAGEIHSQSLLNTVHFGLGKINGIKKIRVRWRNGEEEDLINIKANQIYDVPKNTDNLNFGELLKGVGAENILYDSLEYFNWGSSIVKGDDGKYHLFYAQIPRKLGFLTWLNDGIISRAIADHPEGPYKHQKVVLKGRGFGHWDETTAHNPWIQKYNGKYYLYYISSNYGGRKLTDDELHQSRTKWIDNEFRALVRENQRIGVAVSESIDGPWKRFENPMVEPGGPIVTITCNPSVTQRPDGSYLMLVRGDMPDTSELVRHQAIAIASSPIGPWEVQPKAAVDYLNAEDPAIWYDKKRERYYAIYHAFGYLGLITSLDGINWKRAKYYKIMELAYKDSKGEMVKVTRMERPFLFLENGKPKVLTVSIKLDNGESYSMFIPIEEE